MTGSLMGVGLDPVTPEFPLLSTVAALRERTPSSQVDPAAQWAECSRTALTDLAMDGPRLLGRPRHAVGYIVEVTGARLAEWARADVPARRTVGMDGPAWDRAAELLRDWYRGQEAARLAAIPADHRRADQLTAQRRREQRRAELERELAALGDGEQPDPAPDAAPAPTVPAITRPGGWLRRPISP